MANWITPMLAATPALLWIYVGLGLLWALALLPRRAWHDRPLLLALAFALGPMLLTAWMLLLGTAGSAENPLLRFDVILTGTVVLAAVGGLLAWRKRHPVGTQPATLPLAADERLLIGLIVVASLIRWLTVAYWPFTAYDALWVYGYQGRLYTLLGHIPGSIDYYPQFLQLQYTYAQLAYGGINDHAARAVLPFLNTGSILAAYVLGSQLFTRRVGIIAAALWALYPHMGAWSRFGDLEIPQTFLFTLAAAFFLMAWMDSEPRRRYALLAGLVLGGALWTKPTAGAFVWGVGLLVCIDLLRVRLNWRAWWPRFEVAALTGLACIPLGGVWYVRNLLLGHSPVVFPTGFWLTQASRSGAEFGWPLLALLALLAWLHFGPVRERPNWRYSLGGLLLVLAALLPTILIVNSRPADITAHRLGMVEWALLAAGGGLLLYALLPLLRKSASAAVWALLLALPYFITWFYSYSYHYRLSFAIVPLLLLPTAAIVGTWFPPVRLPRSIYLTAIILASLPAISAPLYDPNAGWDWLWTDKLADDRAKYTSGNEALMNVVEGFEIYKQEHPDSRLSVVAPGIVRLPFFFPLDNIRTAETPTRFSELDGVAYLVYGSPESSGAYQNIPLQENQVVGAFARTGTTVENIMRRAWGKDDGIFRYQVYELNLDRRFEESQMFHDPPASVVFGDFARYRGHGIGASTLWPGRTVFIQMYWQGIAPADRDYTIYLHLRDSSGKVWATWDGPLVSPEFDDGLYYSTRLWEPGEFIVDERRLRLPDDVPEGDDYALWLGFYELETQERLPVTVDGQPAGDGYRVNENITVLTAEPPPAPQLTPEERQRRRAERRERARQARLCISAWPLTCDPGGSGF